MTVDDPMHVEASEERILPQPTNPEAKSYRYLKFEQIEDEFFGDQENIQKPSTLLPDTLCWVYLSKGKGKRPQIHKRARVESSCEDDEERVLVKYPNGSTYRVRRTNLVPVLEHQSHLILVCSETKDYHRTSIVHTRQEDNFLEIGCDFGILVDKVDAKTRLGVDKSEESIKGARERYPNRAFLLGDVFEDDLNITLESPAVVAIDINGNRMLPAVLDCIQLALEKWSPRLIVVKSRELYAKLR